MKTDIGWFVGRVLTLIGETPSPMSGFASEHEGIALRTLVTSLVEEGVATALSSLPLEMFETTADFPVSGAEVSDGNMYVPVPEDFFRFAGAKLSGWTHGLSTLPAPGSRTLRLLDSPLKALRGARSRPAARITHARGQRMLQLTPADGDSSLEYAHYIPLPHIDETGSIEIPGTALHAALRGVAQLARNALDSAEG